MGEWISIFVYSAALVLHEEAHFLFARALGYRVISLELYPFGFCAQLDRRIFAWDELCISFAGPLCSIFAGVSCVAIGTFENSPPVVKAFAEANFSIGFVNLLPAVPLDGGRVLRGFLQAGSVNAQRFISVLSVSISLLFIALGFFLLIKFKNPTALVMGTFLLSSAIPELSECKIKKLQSHMETRSRIARGETIPVSHFCAIGNTTIGEACRSLMNNGYGVLYVLDSNLTICAELDEGQLLFGTSELGSDSTLFALVDRLRESC